MDESTDEETENMIIHAVKNFLLISMRSYKHYMYHVISACCERQKLKSIARQKFLKYYCVKNKILFMSKLHKKAK